MSFDLDLVRPHLARLPIFPLPDGVLLPYEMLPLHVFEPRYRAMMQDVLAAGRPLAIVRLAPGWEADYEGRPAVEPVCGVGIVARHEKLPDGRFNVLVRGLARVRIERELAPERDWREVQARLLDDAHAAEPESAFVEDIESLRRMLFALCASRPGPAASTLAQLSTQAPSAGALADIVLAALLTDLSERRRALVTLDAAERLRMAQAALAELLVGVDAPAADPRLRN